MEEKRTKYEELHLLVGRKDLRKNVLGLMDELNDSEFHSIYDLIWSITAKDLLLKGKESQIASMKVMGLK